MLGLAVLLLSTAAPARASIFTLNFEGLKDLETLQNFYNGGTGSLGSSGTNYGVTFSSNALSVIDADAGGSGNFGGEPSASTVLFFHTGTLANVNVASGFDTGLMFYYSAPLQPGSLTIYDGVNGTGNILASQVLPLTPLNGAPDPNGQFSPFVPVSVAFNGIAKSVDFAGTIDLIGIDNITFGTPSPTDAVPEPATCLLLGSGIAAFGLRRFRRKPARKD